MRTIHAAGIVLVLVGLAFAQDAPIVRTGNTEVGGFVGASYGVDKTRVMGGGNIAYALTRIVMPYAEFSYFPGIGKEESIALGTAGRVDFKYSVPLADFHGGVHLRLPIRESRVIPYGVFGVGMLHSYGRTEKAIIRDPLLGNLTIDVPVPSRNDFAVNFGGGLRFYLSEMFGLRAEAKAYKPTGAVGTVFGKVEGGFFFQLK